MNKKRTFYLSTFIIYILLWTVTNLIFLDSFPFMHTDESWLAGLSRAMLAKKTPAATEPFFNLVPRSPHAVKILFHFLQIILIKILGYSLFSVRLLSLIAGAGSLAVFGGICERNKLPPLPCVILLSLQIQFIYASHFARQEILLVLLMLISIYMLKNGSGRSFQRGSLTGLTIAAATGLHPNAFIIAWPSGLILLFDIIRKRRKPVEGIGFLLLPSISAAVLVLISFTFNRNFISDYGSFGNTVGVTNTLDIKLLGFDDFYRKLFMRISGTYYTPWIIPVFLLSAAGTIFLIIRTVAGRQKFPQIAATALLSIVGLNAGTILIGKYSAPSVVFIVPFLILLIAGSIESIQKPLVRKTLYSVTAVLLLFNSVFMISEELTAKNGKGYNDFIQQIKAAVPSLSDSEQSPEHRVLGPLSAEFALENGRLLDWRNLTMLDDAGVSLEQYIEDNHIEYIIYTEEFDVIYNNRPVWNVLYGNPVVYHQQLQDFLTDRCEPVSEFSSPGYGTRIALHRNSKEWMVRVYRVKQGF